jgi:DNA polymerase III epsilon subunit family exonuclease
LEIPTKKRELLVPDYVAFDLETTGLSLDQDEIIEIALVRFENGEPSERWSTLLKPKQRVPLKTLRLTGISTEELDGSPVFGEEIAARIQEFRDGLPLVGHNSEFDIAFLQKMIPGFPGVEVYDTLELSRIVFPGLNSYKLTDLARNLGVTVSEAHRAYDDALVSGGIFRVVQDHVHEIPHATKARIRSIMGSEWVADRLFAASAAEPPVQPGLFHWVPFQGERARPSPRSYDAELAGRIMALLERSEEDLVLADVAGTPDAMETVVSCCLKHSQSHDSRILLIGFPEDYLSHGIGAAREPGDYLCLAKLHRSLDPAQDGGYDARGLCDRRFLASLARWIDITDTGSLRHIQTLGSARLARDLSCQDDLSCRDSCVLAETCYATLAEKSLKLVSLARHDRFKGIRGRWDRVVVWNSHELARAWQWREAKVDPTEMRDVLEQAGILKSVSSLALVTERAREIMERCGAVADSRLQSLMNELLLELKGALKTLENEALLRVVASLEQVLDPAEGTTMVVEEGYGEKGRCPVLARRALWPGASALGHIRRNLGPAIVMSPLSKTLWRSAGLKRYFGLEGSTLEDDLRPKTRAGNVLLAIIDEYPAPSYSQYPSYVSKILRDLILANRTGVQVMFSSKALLKDVYELCVREIEAGGVAVYGVGIDGGRRLVEHLADKDSAVFSTGGFPAYGDPTPSCLVIPKVPFLPPNPLDDLRKREIQGPGVDPFVEVSVAQAVLAIRSHVERQIDSGKRCAVVLCDPKVLPGRSRWAAPFLEHFADLPRVTCSALEVIKRITQWTLGENTDY